MNIPEKRKLIGKMFIKHNLENEDKFSLQEMSDWVDVGGKITKQRWGQILDKLPHYKKAFNRKN